MKQSMKIWIVALVAIIGGLSGFAATTVKKARPNVSEENMLITLPNRFYYFNDQELHCYNTKKGEDTLIEKEFEYKTGGSIFRIDDRWYDPASDCVFFNLDLGRYNKIYQLTPDHSLNFMIALGSGRPGDNVKVTDDYVYLDDYIEDVSDKVKIPGGDEDSRLSAYYTLGLKPWKFTKKSFDSLKRPNIDFYAITAPGVNVRTYGDSKAPRLGFFETRPGWEHEDDFLMTEDADIDKNEYTGKFIPWHPQVGRVFVSSKDPDSNGQWTNIIVDEFLVGELDYEPVISSKFVKQVKTEPLVSMKQFTEEYWENISWKMNSVKYPGLWLMYVEYIRPGDSPMLYIGKEIDGMIVFKWCVGWTISSEEPGRFRIANENGYDTVYFGKDITKNGYELDFSKLNDNDLETLFKVASQNNLIPVVAKIADVGVNTYWVNEESFAGKTTE